MVDVATVLLVITLLTFFSRLDLGLAARRLFPGKPMRAPAACVVGAARRSAMASVGVQPSLPRLPMAGSLPVPPPSAADEEDRARRRAERLLDGVCAALRIPRPAVCPLVPTPLAVRSQLVPIWRDARNVTPRHVTTLGVILACCCADGSRGVVTRRTLGHGDLIVEEGAFVPLRDRRLIEPVVDDGADATGVYDVGLDTPYRLTAAGVAALPHAFRTAMRRCGRLPGKAGADADTVAHTVARPGGWRWFGRR